MEPSYPATSFILPSESSTTAPPNVQPQQSGSSSETHLSLSHVMTSLIEGAMSSHHGYKISETFFVSLYRDLMAEAPSKEGRYAEKVDLFISTFSLLPSSMKDLHKRKLGDVFLHLRSKFLPISECVKSSVFKEKWYYQILDFVSDLIIDDENLTHLTLASGFKGLKGSKWVSAYTSNGKNTGSLAISKLASYEWKELRQNIGLMLDMLCLGSYAEHDLFHLEEIPTTYKHIQSNVTHKVRCTIIDFLDRIRQLTLAWRTSPQALAFLETALLLLIEINERRNPSLRGGVLTEYLNQVRNKAAVFHDGHGKRPFFEKSVSSHEKLNLLIRRLNLPLLARSENSLDLSLMTERLKELFSTFVGDDLKLLVDFVQGYPLIAHPFCSNILKHVPALILHEDLDFVLTNPASKSSSRIVAPSHSHFEDHAKAKNFIGNILQNMFTIAKAISAMEKTDKDYLTMLTMFSRLSAKPGRFDLSPSGQLDRDLSDKFDSVVQGLDTISFEKSIQELTKASRSALTIQTQVVTMARAKVTPFLLRQTIDHFTARASTKNILLKTLWNDLVASRSSSKNPAFPIRQEIRQYSDLNRELAALTGTLHEYRQSLTEISLQKASQIIDLDTLLEANSETLKLDLEPLQRHYFETERQSLKKRKDDLEKEIRVLDVIARDGQDPSLEEDPFFLQQASCYDAIKEMIKKLEDQNKRIGKLISFVKLQDLENVKSLNTALMESLVWEIACCVDKNELFAPTSTISLMTQDQIEFKAGIQTIHEGTLMSQFVKNQQVPQISLARFIESFAASVFFGMWDAHPANIFIGPSPLDATDIAKFFDNARTFPHSNRVVAFGELLLLPYRFGLLGMEKAYEMLDKEHVQLLKNEFLDYKSRMDRLEVFFKSYHAQKIITNLPQGWFVLEDALKAIKERLSASLDFIDKHQDGLILRDLIFHVFPYAKFAFILTFISNTTLHDDQMNTSGQYVDLQKQLGLELGGQPLDRLIRTCCGLAVNPRQVYELSQRDRPFEEILKKAKDLYDRGVKIRARSSSSSQSTMQNEIEEYKKAGNLLIDSLRTEAIIDLKEEKEEEIRLHLRDSVLADCRKHKLKINNNTTASVEFLKEATRERARRKNRTVVLIHDVWNQEKIYLYWSSHKKQEECQGPFELNYQRHLGKILWDGQATPLSVEELSKHFK